MLYPTFKASFPNDVKLATKKNIFFKRVKNGKVIRPQQFEKVKQEFESQEYQKLIKRNLKYLRETAICRFRSRPSLFLINKLLKQELYQKDPSLFYSVHRVWPGTDFKTRIKNEFTSSVLFLLRSKISLKLLQIFPFIMNSNYYQRKFLRYLKNVPALSLTYNQSLEMDAVSWKQYISPDLELDKMSKGLPSFKDLQIISLDFSQAYFDFPNEEKIISSQAFLCEIIKILSQIPTLKTIEIKMGIIEIEKKAQKMKGFTEKLTQLKSLKLDLNLAKGETGKFFATLLPLPTLRHLSINLSRNFPSLNCSDLADFISSLKYLDSFEFTCQNLLFDQYVLIFQAIQKLKSLTKLTVVQMTQSGTSTSFAYGIIFKTLGVLKNLTSLKLDLGSRFDDKELDAYPQHLLKHPALKEANITLQVSDQGCSISEGFYANIHRLREKLQKFKLLLRDFPVEIEMELRRIITKEKDNLKNFICGAGKSRDWRDNDKNADFILEEK